MKKLALIILDGFGIGKQDKTNAIYLAKTPFFDKLWKDYPHTILQASGEAVGLPANQLGGSEVGHLTIGAGKILYQDLPRINRALAEPQNPKFGILQNKNFQLFLTKARKQPTHLIGLVSPGGIHSHYHHLFSLLKLMKEQGSIEPHIHFISDGRDTLPQDGINYAYELVDLVDKLSYGKIVDVVGRFYAMDRDRNWERTQKAIDLIAYGKADHSAPDLLTAFRQTYANKLTDELQPPIKISGPYSSGIRSDEILLFFNFRSDRMKQLVTKLHELLPNNLLFTMTQYDKNYPYPVFFEKQHVTMTLGKIISNQGIYQLRAAETDKIPHVSYFFNGGTEVVYPGEIHAFVESTKVTYDKTPEMKAKEIVELVQEKISQQPAIGFIVVNFANTDLVPHFGDMSSTIIAVETVDRELNRLCEFLVAEDFICIITSDHGHADYMIDEKTGITRTAHSLNPVPFIVYAPHDKKLCQLKLDQNPNNGLSKVAGTVLDLMGLPRPIEDFESLIVKNTP